MANKCNNCERVISTDDLEYGTETKVPMGDGMVTSHTALRCPHCGNEDDFEEVVKCEECDQYFDDLHNGYCESCLGNLVTYDRAKKYGESSPEAVIINGFLVDAFDTDEIETILFRELDGSKEEEKTEAARQYCLYDEYHYSDWLKENEEV